MRLVIVLAQLAAVPIRDLVLIYAPIVVSVLALLYARRAYVLQADVHRSRHISRVVVFLRYEPKEQRGTLRLLNPDKSTFFTVEGYVHWNLQRYRKSVYVEMLTLGACSDECIELFPMTHGISSSGRLPVPVISGLLKWKVGRPLIGEVLAKDSDGQVWYLNTDGRKRRIPKAPILRTFYLATFRWRGFSLFDRLTTGHYVGFAILLLDFAIIFDHVANGGDGMLKVLDDLNLLRPAVR